MNQITNYFFLGAACGVFLGACFCGAFAEDFALGFAFIVLIDFKIHIKGTSAKGI